MAQNRLAEVFAGLQQVAPNHDSLVLLQARHHRNEQAKQQNTIYQSDYDVERNRIGAALLNLIEELVKE